MPIISVENNVVEMITEPDPSEKKAKEGTGKKTKGSTDKNHKK